MRISDWSSDVCSSDLHGDWLDQRDRSFEAHIALGDKKGSASVLFERYSGGVSSGRDAWVYNYSREALSANMERMVATYNTETERFDGAFGSAPRQAKVNAVDGFVDADTAKISWTRALKRSEEHTSELQTTMRISY